MFSKLLSFWQSIRHQFINYFITGISGTILDLGSLYLLENFLGWRPTVAVAFNQIVVIAYIFCLNKYWVFKARGLAHKQVVRYLEVYAFNYAVAVGIMWIGNEQLGFNSLLVRLFNIALSVSWNFLLYKYWVYQKSGVDNSSQVALD
jgi:putative flippase GtrA